MNLLELVTEACGALKVPRPVTVVNSTDESIRQFLVAAGEETDSLVANYDWVQLRKSYSFTLVANQANYPEPKDLMRWIPDTRYNATNTERVYGALTAQQYSAQVSGGGIDIFSPQFYISNQIGGEIQIVPTPTASTAGQVLTFLYQSNEAIRPATWVTNTPILTGAFRWWNNNKYFSVSGNNAITGANPPVHTNGTVSDGGVLWTYSSEPYTKWLADIDVPILDDRLIYFGLKYRWKQMNEYPFEVELAQYRQRFGMVAAAKAAPSVLSLNNVRWGDRFQGPYNVNVLP